MAAALPRACVALLGLVAAAAVPRLARAQASAPIAVTADVSTTALSVSNTLDLRFGTVVPGTPTVINPQTNVNAAQFVVSGARNAEVSVTTTLPSALTVGPYSMPIAFGAQGGCYRRMPGQAGCTFWNPAANLTVRIRNQNPPNNHLYIWIGGTVSPDPTQHPGVYHGTVGISVVYTGN